MTDDVYFCSVFSVFLINKFLEWSHKKKITSRETHLSKLPAFYFLVSNQCMGRKS